ncbi:hypothetical protein [Neobacillus sp. PS3-40]|uniref:hypothetical protein n=1 Tax=Neobacillus sp. PS3-40 TaxID=3070679 RepID=UPI0027DFDC4E|nr:hypothetical protein [Neobacillus sp. PS3-40]WML43854.1 hypothetical protein RCG20_19030 [Neobacillus sp. PS3-40]
MKKNIFTIFMYVLAIVGLIITLFIVYKNIDNSFATKFVIGYVIFLFLFLFYFGTLSIINLRKLKWVEIRKRLYKFIISFILISCFAFIFYYFKKPSEINFYKILFLPLAISLGSAFSDLPFLGKK